MTAREMPWCHTLRNHVLHIVIPEEVFAALERTAKTMRQPLEEIAVTWLANAAETRTDSLNAVIESFSSEIAWATNMMFCLVNRSEILENVTHI